MPPPANSLLAPRPGFTSVPDHRMPGPPGAPATFSLQAGVQVAAVPPGPPRFEVTVVPATRDRKSTRLNSSHLGTSYAGFCLKKKNSVNSVVVTVGASHTRTLPTA